MSFRRVGLGLPGLVADWIEDPGLRWQLLVRTWSDLVGEAVANHSTPQSLERGVLTVRVVEPEWRRTLEQMEPELLASLQKSMGERLVTAIRWVPEI